MTECIFVFNGFIYFHVYFMWGHTEIGINNRINRKIVFEFSASEFK